MKQTKHRYKRKNDNLQQLLNVLKEKGFFNANRAQILESTVGHTRETFSRIMSKTENAPHRKRFSLELRAFALTLHYHSVSVYNFEENLSSHVFLMRGPNKMVSAH